VPDVTCCICGQPWLATSPNVEYRALDGRWWCADESACTARRARAEAIATPYAGAGEVAAMYRALDSVWDRLELEGWRLS
jgi:hypothetical protein